MPTIFTNPLLKKPVINIQSWGIGKHIETIYTLETTKHDPEVEELYFSNIHCEEFKSLETALSRLNTYQQLGYHNINLVATTYNTQTNKHIKEESVNGLEMNVNTYQQQKEREENERLKKQLEEMENKINMYEAFIKKYNSTKLYEEFEKSQK